MSYEDYEPEDMEYDWRTLRQSVHTSRKPRTCDNCGGVIQAGEKYSVMVALDEGSFVLQRDHFGGCPILAEEIRQAREKWEAERLATLPIGPDEVPF